MRGVAVGVLSLLAVGSAALAVSACKKAAPARRDAAVAAVAPMPDAAASTAGDVAFWTWFDDNAARLHAMDNLVDAMNDVGAQLEGPYPGVLAEIEKGEDGQRALVLTADGERELFPIISRLAAGAPTVA